MKALISKGLGCLDYIRKSGMQDRWGGPFNGQQFRQRIFFDLLRHFAIKAIVETGTYRGTTTALFAETALPVYSVESHPRLYSFSRMRFRHQRSNIHLYNNDSRAFLAMISNNATVPKEDVFFYLDAHWQDDLPLREELEVIFTNWTRPIVMIDDFQVPDSDYSFDDYGSGKTLNLDYLQPAIAAHNIAVFFPAVNAVEETGVKRGCVVLCPQETAMDIEKSISTLLRYPADMDH